MVTHYANTRQKRQARIRAKISGTTVRPRVSVFRSNKVLYVQVIDDTKGITVIGLNEAKSTEKNKIKKAHLMGIQLASSLKKKKISQVVFDRGGFAYHGRIKALAEGMREGGITL